MPILFLVHSWSASQQVESSSPSTGKRILTFSCSFHPPIQRLEVKKAVIGNPKTVPAGRYAEEALRHFNLWDAIKDKLIFVENVRQALDYVARDEVDAGLVYSTDAMARSKEVKVVMKLPEGSHQPAVYPIGVIKGTKEETLSRAFVDFVLSAEGQRILNKYGFITVSPLA